MIPTRCISLLLIALLLFSSGCASKYGEQKTTVEYYPACYKPIEDLRQSEHGKSKTTVAGIIIGGTLGVVGGAVIGAASGFRPEGIAAGAIVGAIAGGLISNIYWDHHKIKEDNKRLATYLETIDGNITGMDVVTASATSSLQCYDREFNLLITAMRDKTIDKDAAAKRFAEISSGREEAINILVEVSKYGRDLHKEYEGAMHNEKVELLDPTPPQTKKPKPRLIQQYHERRRNIKTNEKAIQRVTNKSEQLIEKSDSIKRLQNEAESVTAKQTEEINKIMADLADIRA